MIKVLGKFTDTQGDVVAYKISDDGFESVLPHIALYSDAYFHEFLNSGFVYQDSEGNVLLPDGVTNIKDVEECDEVLNRAELVDMIDTIESTGILDEKDIVQYFKRDVKVEEVSIKYAKNPKYNTREEFERYIELIDKANKSNVNVFTPYNINTIVNKDALYSIDEIVKDVNIRSKFKTLFSIYTMRFFSQVKQMYASIISSDDSTIEKDMMKFIDSFFEYGVPGINSKIVSKGISISPTESLRFIDNGREHGGEMHYLGAVRNSDGTFFSVDTPYGCIFNNSYNPRIFEPVVDVFRNVKSHTSVAYSKEYVHRSLYPQIDITFMSEDGATAVFRADIDGVLIEVNRRPVVNFTNFFNFVTLTNITIPMSRILENGINFISDYVVIDSYVSKLVKDRTVKPKFNSTFEIITNSGISPYFAHIVILKLLKLNPSMAETWEGFTVTGPNSNINLYWDAMSRYIDGFSDHILEKYGSVDEYFKQLPQEEQLEIINDTIYRLQEEGNYLVKGVDVSYFGTDEVSKEIADNEVNNINFINNILNGIWNIGEFGSGKLADEYTVLNSISEFVYSCYCMSKNSGESQNLEDFLNMYVTDYIDVESLIKVRSGAARGCEKDLMLYRDIASSNVDNLVYVTKIIRVNDNEDALSCVRHWGFEGLVFNVKGSKDNRSIYQYVHDTLVTDMMNKGHKVLSTVNTMTANAIFYLSSSINLTNDVDGFYYVDLPYVSPAGDKEIVQLKLSYTYAKYITGNDTISPFTKQIVSCFDFCTEQFNGEDVNFYCVNANITPWRVIPINDFKIPSYNFYWNYFDINAIKKSGILPSDVIDARIVGAGSKPIDSLVNCTPMISSFSMDSDVLSINEIVSKAKAGGYLLNDEYEDIDAYAYRTFGELQSNNGIVKNTVLKADIFYNKIKPFVQTDYDEVDESSTYYTDGDASKAQCYITQHRMTEETGTVHTKAINQAGGSISKISINDLEYTDIISSALANTDFSADTCPVMFKGEVRYGNNVVNIINPSYDDMVKLVNDKIAVQINSSTFIIKLVNMLLKVEV